MWFDELSWGNHEARTSWEQLSPDLGRIFWWRHVVMVMEKSRILLAEMQPSWQIVRLTSMAM